MKKINDLTVKMHTKLDEMRSIVEQVIAENRTKDEDEQKRYNTLDNEVKNIEAQIREFKFLEELNKRTGTPADIKEDENTPLGVQFRDFLHDAVESGKTSKFGVELRADPIITTTQTGIINKTVADSVDILRSPAEAFLRSLGVTFYSGLTGNFIIPAMAQNTAAFVAEDVSAASANMGHDALTLTARRVTHTQKISTETLNQTNPAIYTSILQNLVNGVWNAVTNDLFDQIDADAATQIQLGTAAGLTYGDLVKMEASIGGLDIGTGAYVTTPTVKAFLKQKALLGTDNGPIWKDNEINGYPAFGVPAANAAKVYFGDFGKTAVGQWGDLEIIVDPYSDAKKGLLNLTVIGLFDTGCFNKRGINIIQNASTGV